MYRFSTGLSVMEGNDKDTRYGYLIYEGKSYQNVMTHSTLWSPKNIFNDNRRFWILNEPGVLKAVQKPLPDDYFDSLSIDLDQVETDEIHPTLLNGPQNETKRLFPRINVRTEKKYVEFIDFLEIKFGLSESLNATSKFGAFSEDIGPCMIGLLNNKYIKLPEWPKLYKAPLKWRKLTWLLNNYFSGPYDADTEVVKAMAGKRFHWGNLHLEDHFKNISTEGLVYFFISKLILSYQAWMKEEDSTSLKDPRALDDFIDLVKDHGIRPWQYLY